MIRDFLFWHVYLPIETTYYDLMDGVQRLGVDGCSARFEGSSSYGGDIIRQGFRRETDILVDLVSTELAEEDTFLDVGANIGLYSCFAAQKVTAGTVIAVEPFPPNVTQLRRNLALNSAPADFTIDAVAFTDADGEVGFTPPEQGATGTETASLDVDQSSFRVETARGDSLFEERGYPTPNVVKIDVEGEEYGAINGLERTLSRDGCRCVYCEVHESASVEGNRQKVLTLLQEYGFEIENRWESPAGSATVIKAKR